MSIAYMRFYIGDYLADTRSFTTLEHGAYLLLIMEYWQNGSLPTDEDRLARIAGLSAPEWHCVRNAIASKFSAKWNHKRIDKELEKMQVKSLKAVVSASKRWNGKQETGNANALRRHLRSHAKRNANQISESKSLSTIVGNAEAGTVVKFDTPPAKLGAWREPVGVRHGPPVEPPPNARKDSQAGE